MRLHTLAPMWWALSADDDCMRTVEITYRCEDTRGPSRPRPTGADDALYRLREGNRVFASLFDGLAEGTGTTRHTVDINPRDLGLLLGEDGLPSQRPFAAVLGCSDARVPVELIFSEGPNDLFVVRVAGNGLGAEVLGSLQYAIDHLRDSLRLVVVLGHSGCGALSAAVDLFLDPAGYLPLASNHTLRTILDRQLIVVQATARRLASIFGQDVSRRTHYREALIEASIGINAALTAYAIQQELRGIDPRHLRAVYGVYLLQSREVWGPRAGDADNGLAEPPRDADGFIQLGSAIVRSARITSLLNSD
jgi:carbonic anhydrase